MLRFSFILEVFSIFNGNLKLLSPCEKMYKKENEFIAVLLLGMFKRRTINAKYSYMKVIQ